MEQLLIKKRKEEVVGRKEGRKGKRKEEKE